MVSLLTRIEELEKVQETTTLRTTGDVVPVLWCRPGGNHVNRIMCPYCAGLQAPEAEGLQACVFCGGEFRI